MHVARTVPDLRRAVAALPRPLAFAPTMGALHAGHVALVAEGRRDAGPAPDDLDLWTPRPCGPCTSGAPPRASWPRPGTVRRPDNVPVP